MIVVVFIVVYIIVYFFLDSYSEIQLAF